MRRNGIFSLALVLLACTAWAYACGGGDGGTAPETPDPPRPTTVAVNPATADLTALGATAQLSAEVRDQNGRAMGATVTWSSENTAVATVDASGLVAAAGNGTATIAASAGRVSGSGTVTVAQVVSAVEVTPANGILLPDATLQLAAEARDVNGHAVAGSEVSWASSDTGGGGRGRDRARHGDLGGKRGSVGYIGRDGRAGPARGSGARRHDVGRETRHGGVRRAWRYAAVDRRGAGSSRAGDAQRGSDVGRKRHAGSHR